MSSADLLERPAAAPVAYRGTFARQVRSELRLIFRRRRNLALLVVLATIPILIGVALKLSNTRGPDGNSAPSFLGLVTDNGMFLAFAALTACLPVFLPLAVAVVGGDSVAGEASAGTLRYLLTVPVSRGRLLAVKAVGVASYLAGAVALVCAVGLVTGTLLFGTHDVVLLSGDTVSQWDGLVRTLGVSLFVFVDLLGLAAMAVFFSTVTEVPVGAMAATWTDQPGFPLVSVTTTCEGGRTLVTLAQQRFRYDTVDRSAASSAATPVLPRWRIPVRLARGTTAWTVLLADAQATTTLPGCSDEPVRANAGGHGYYHVAYEPEAMRALHHRFASLPAPDRVALLADTLALAQAGRLPLSEGLRWLTLLPQVRDAGRVPLFKQAIEAFALLDKALAGSPEQSAMRESARDLLASELARLGWEPRPQDDPETLALRAGLVRQLASMDDGATLEQALTRVTRDESGAEPLHPSMRDDVRIAAGASADRARFDRTLAALLAASSEQERRTLARALASGRDPGRVDELLDRMLQGDLPNNLATSMPARVAALSPFGDRAYRHVVEHWSAWEQLAGPTGKRWLLPETAENSNDPAQGRALIADQARLAGPDGAMLAARAAARIEQLAAIKARAAMPGP